MRRVADALREVPGLAVVQTGAPGQLTSVFTRGLRSEHTQVLLDGIPINQGLAGLFNFADLTTDNIDRIEIVRGPQSTLYGPRALAGVIQIFTKAGSGTPVGNQLPKADPSVRFANHSEAPDHGSNSITRSARACSIPTTSARTTNTDSATALANVGWSPNEQLRIGSLFAYSNADTGNPDSIFIPSRSTNS